MPECLKTRLENDHELQGIANQCNRETRNYIFRPSKKLIRSSGTANPPPLDLYNVAYTEKASTPNPEKLLQIYNSDFSRKEPASSLSVSNIIEYTFPSGKKPYFFCDYFGFDPVDFD